MPVSRQSNKRVKAAELAKTQPGFSIKYPKPKILLLDLSDSIFDSLVEKGFNVRAGSLGKPYRVAKGDGYQPLIGTANLPNYTEQEIIVVDLTIRKLADGPEGEKHMPHGEPDLWAKCNRGLIDPRPRASYQARDIFDRTLSSGGVFIVFADAKTHINLVIARSSTGRFGGLYDQEVFPYDVWDLLSECADMKVDDEHGTEMYACDEHSSLGQLIARHLDGGSFSCTLEGGYRSEDEWLTLAENKFRLPVALCRCRGEKGSVIILPELARKTEFVTALFTDVLPELAPPLFPDIVRGKWTHRPEYELPKVLELRTAQSEIDQRARNEIAVLEVELENERKANGWLHDLLTGSDDVLVRAVKEALSALGFEKVVDIDEQRDREGKSRREDIQIHHQSPILIVDVKGIGNVPTDADALQADKHAAIRMRELGRTDVIGLSIINHQRNMPGLERENKMPFRRELLDAAEERTLGLMTTWDIYRLVRNLRRLGWRTEDVKPLFYKKGRIEAVPTHYQLIGTIEKVWTDKFGVVISENELCVGDRVAIELPIEFGEIEVASLHVNDKNVERASIGHPTGLLWSAGKPKLREGLRVFRIQRPTPP